MMFIRFKRKELQSALLRSPAVVLLGPRQVGKTTLALDVAQPYGGYLDLESSRKSIGRIRQCGQLSSGM
jgi:predicted AAA+ superfamily ATPase